MKHHYLLAGIIFQIIFLLPLTLFGQEIDFSCDPNFEFYQKAWINEDWNEIYNSLNDIDFTKIDFELRFWEHGSSHAGTTFNVFIMRHHAKSNKWKAYYHVGFQSPGTHKTMKEYFSGARLRGYKQKELKLLWDTLVNHNILTLSHSSRDSLSQLLGGEGRWIYISHDTRYVVELIKKDCRRSYGFSHGFIHTMAFEEIPEFVDFRAILSLINQEVDVRKKIKNK